MRTMYASNRATLNCVAVDVVAKTLIVAGWKCAMDYDTIDILRESNENLNDRQFSVYNCASQHFLNLELLVYQGQYLVRQYPFERFVWLPSGGVTLCKFMNYFRVSFVSGCSQTFDLDINERPKLQSICPGVIEKIQ